MSRDRRTVGQFVAGCFAVLVGVVCGAGMGSDSIGSALAIVPFFAALGFVVGVGVLVVEAIGGTE